jgi:tetratricopeptide (TPR) repeat protein
VNGSPDIDVDTVLAEAHIDRESGRLEDAESRLAAAHAAAPGAVEFPAHLGSVRLALGQYEGAAEAFRAALAMAPEASVLYLGLATTLNAANDYEGAIVAFQNAAGRDPENPAIHNNMGLTLRRVGRHEEAVDALRRATELAPDKASFHANLARILQDDGQLDAAKVAAETAVFLDPDSVDGLVNLGCILRDLGRPNDAVQVLRQAAMISSDLPEAWLNLGLALRDNGDIDKAIQAFGILISLQPELAEAHANLGRMLHQAFRFAEAEASYRTALELRPEDSQALANFASLLLDHDRIDPAERACRLALRFDPDNVTALANLACILSEQGDYAEAIRLNVRAMEIAPDNIQIQRNVADPLFLSGHFAQAWQAYDYRWHKTERPRRPFPQEEWKGGELEGRSLLVWAEQGIGDTLVFSTCLQDVIDRAKRVFFEVDRRLVPLYARTFPDLHVVARSDPPDAQLLALDVDLHCPVGSLPAVLRPALEDFPSGKTFLTVDADRRAHWRNILNENAGQPVKVGFFWRSGAANREFIRAYPSLEDWLPVLRQPGVEFVSFQYGENIEPMKRFADENALNMRFIDNIDHFNDLDEVAAMSAACDFFVGPVTTNCWISAAVGVPTLVAGLPDEWLTLGADNLPWLPAVEYVRRSPEGPWQQTIKHIADRLQSLTASASPS